MNLRKKSNTLKLYKFYKWWWSGKYIFKHPTKEVIKQTCKLKSKLAFNL
jgi:hypothetical protein